MVRYEKVEEGRTILNMGGQDWRSSRGGGGGNIEYGYTGLKKLKRRDNIEYEWTGLGKLKRRSNIEYGWTGLKKLKRGGKY